MLSLGKEDSDVRDCSLEKTQTLQKSVTPEVIALETSLINAGKEREAGILMPVPASSYCPGLDKRLACFPNKSLHAELAQNL